MEGFPLSKKAHRDKRVISSMLGIHTQKEKAGAQRENVRKTEDANYVRQKNKEISKVESGVQFFLSKSTVSSLCIFV